MKCFPYQARKIKYTDAFIWANLTSGVNGRAYSFNDQPAYSSPMKICWGLGSIFGERGYGKPCIIDFDIKGNLNQITYMYFNEDGEVESGVEIHDIKDVNEIHPDYQELCRIFLKKNRL